jgi:hypothetical protein
VAATRIPEAIAADLIFDESDIGSASLAETNRLTQAVEAARRGEAHGWTALFERFTPMCMRMRSLALAIAQQLKM